MSFRLILWAILFGLWYFILASVTDLIIYALWAWVASLD